MILSHIGITFLAIVVIVTVGIGLGYAEIKILHWVAGY